MDAHSLMKPDKGIIILDGFFFFDKTLLSKNDPIVQGPVTELYRCVSQN